MPPKKGTSEESKARLNRLKHSFPTTKGNIPLGDKDRSGRTLPARRGYVTEEHVKAANARDKNSIQSAADELKRRKRRKGKLDIEDYE